MPAVAINKIKLNIVVAMAQNSNREQRQALDRQLSDQAFYNAETGINDWAEYLYSNRDDTSLPPEKTNCDNTGFTNAPVPEIDGPEGVNTYTCLLYNKAPSTLEFDTVSVSDSIVTPIEPYELPGSSRLNSLQFKWISKDGATGTACNFSATSPLGEQLPSGCDIGGLRIDLVNPSGFNRNEITRNNFPAYLVPGQASGSNFANLSYANIGSIPEQGVIGTADCDNGECRLSINNLNLAERERLYLHIKGLYKTVNLTITACHAAASPCPPTQQVRFNSSQIEIDSTGKSNDVLRRVKVRVPAQSQFENAGSFSLKTTQSICKLVRVEQNEATLDNRCQ